MHGQVEKGFIVLADISGFEAYLAGVELEHANGVLAELLELLMARLVPPLQFASVERDAILTYAPDESAPPGQTFFDLTEATYAAFRDRVQGIYRTTTCGCRACLTIPTLDLKFLVHYGEYVPHAIGETVDLGGLDARLVRERQIKDQAQAFNGHAYAMFTDPSLDRIGLRPDDLLAGRGEYPVLGELHTGSIDLRARYEALLQAREVYVSTDEAYTTTSIEFDVPPQVLWDWLNDPEKRTLWMRYRSWQTVMRPGGRMGIGAQNHCSHGLGIMEETVLDWRPYDYFTVRQKSPPLWDALITTWALEALPSGGTHLTVRMRLEDDTMRALKQPMVKAWRGIMHNYDFKQLARLIDAAPSPS